MSKFLNLFNKTNITTTSAFIALALSLYNFAYGFWKNKTKLELTMHEFFIFNNRK